MNILRLVQAEKEKKNSSQNNPAYHALEQQASRKDYGQTPIRFSQEVLREKLTPVQYYVTQQKGTEKPFSGVHLRQKEDGVFTCVLCENPIFASETKYDTMCGWLSFTDVIAKGTVTLKKDTAHGLSRIEVSCSQCNAHMGHVFDDGPKPQRIRYCVNSASLDFKKHTAV